jgi:nucleoside-diphosphate-sugar epimerase
VTYDTDNLYFILGGKGFVGSAFARFCQNTGTKHVVIDRQNYNDHVGKSCDVLINASGSSSKVLATKDPLQDFDATVRNTRKSLVDFKFKKYVLISSCDVYPDCSSPVTTKEDLEIDVSKQSPYGFHKYLAEECVRHGTSDWLIVRLGGMVGPGLKKNPIFDILNGGPLWLDPKSQLQYMRTDDVSKITSMLIQRNLKQEIFNVCGKGLVKLEDILKNHKVNVNPGSPQVKYDINIDKISKITVMPDSVNTVMNFIQEIRG